MPIEPILPLGDILWKYYPKKWLLFVFFHMKERFRCNPDVAPRLNADKFMLLPQSKYLLDGVPDCFPLVR